jgi:hypothetical protein
MTSLRLSAEMEEKVLYFSKARNVSKTNLIINALDKFFKEEEEFDSYELGKACFGKFGSGLGNLSADYKKQLREKIGVKYRPC